MIKEHKPKHICKECNIGLVYVEHTYSPKAKKIRDCKHTYDILAKEQYSNYPDIIQYECSKCGTTAGFYVATNEWLEGIPLTDISIWRCPKCHKQYEMKI